MEASDLELKSTDCPICHEQYNHPKILPCTHVICRKCLASWMNSGTNAKCPLCRSVIADSRRSEINNVDAIIDRMPTDEETSLAVYCAKLLNKTRVCYVHTNVEAPSVCLQCDTMLCQNCIEVHQKMPTTSMHELKDFQSLTPEKLMTSRHVSCCAHPDKTSEYFCSIHEILMCPLCAFSQHRECPQVIHSDSALEYLTQSYSEMNNDLMKAESVLTDTLERMEDYLVKSETNTSTAVFEINMMFDRLMHAVETGRERLLKLVKDADAKIKKAAQKQKVVLDHKLGRVTSHESLIKRLQNMSHGTFVAMVPRLKDRIQDIVSDLSLPPGTTSLHIATLTIDKNIIARLEEEMAIIGELDVYRTSVEQQHLWRFHSIHGKNIVLLFDGATAQLKDHGFGMVFSNTPMRKNMLYEIRVEEIDKASGASEVRLGVIRRDPGNLVLKEHAAHIESCIAIRCGEVLVNGLWTVNKCCGALETLKVGSRVGMAIDGAQCLHLYVNGRDQGVVYRDLKEPCYAMIDLRKYFIKVVALPLTCTS